MSHKNASAIIALPCTLDFAMADASCRRWLMRARIDSGPAEPTLLHSVCRQLREPLPTAGLAALRYQGQTGVPPSGWLAGADPVWLQAGLDKLYLHAFSPEDLDPYVLGTLYGDLQQTLFGTADTRLEAIGGRGYLWTTAGLATSPLPAEAISGQRPDSCMPGGAGAARYLQLNGEVQLALHDHPSNQQREQAGQQPVNGLWLWGGGEAAGSDARDLPMLYANDPLLRGYWLHSEAHVADWPGSFASCINPERSDFVAALPAPARADGMEPVASVLSELQALQRERRLQVITLLFQDGHVIRVRPGDRYRIWRRPKARTVGLES